MKNKNNRILLMFDHDGTICHTNNNAYESIIYAANMAARSFDIEIHDFINNWDDIFAQTTGTTEAQLVTTIAQVLGITQQQEKYFIERFYNSRTYWYKNMKDLKEYVWDTYYPDFLELTSYLGDKNYIYSIVTGNTRDVISERMPKFISNLFQVNRGNIFGTFGEDAFTRKDLLTLNIQKTVKEYNFTPQYDSNGFIKNAYYIADSENDLFAALQAKIKIVWIPTRKLQDLIKDKSRKDIKLIHDLLPGSFLITNGLDSQEVKDFIKHNN